MKNRVLAIIIIIANIMPISQGFTQNISYDKKLTRLSEVLGSLHYLYSLCGDETSLWRDKMNLLLNAEQADASRKAKLTNAFNSGYRAFSENYYQCTPAALSAIKLYNDEGQKLSQELIDRFGN
ncbi:TIGR02301 family protein [Bartonella sp. HY329]|uniref:TIGR02301 family protein n=1 Tax=unclassified Bartonella TaxID=2645622 RepID=UPI0021C7BBA1|nr:MULTISPECIES: TIGR02301 family protein [unclassified Bartonella]UXM93864.1 TIGR02301 family protein [Bartonella sp. HY329]UXN08185.1 TIGR02301 family protein [Bartonella sp. HY328]